MPIDYSKWDDLELSDDSDIEVHPNVDKRSFIRAKQNQIHADRARRKHHIETLKYERLVNDGLLARITALLTALRAHAGDAQTQNPGEVAFRAVMESAGAGGTGSDRPPPRPAGVHSEEPEPPTYTKMMAALLDQVNKALDEKKPADRYAALTAEIEVHKTKVQGLQKELLAKLGELEREEGRKITSESIHTGFDSSFVNKAKASEGGREQAPAQVELLNPSFAAPRADAPSASASQTKGDAAAAADSDDDIEASPAGKKFAQIPSGDYRASLAFISSHPEIMTERETDGLLVLAFNAALEAQDDFARQCVHQALLIQYCRALGRDGVQLFFKRITTNGHQAQDVFHKDVQETYNKIHRRAREILKQRAEDKAAGKEEGVEQIQLHAVDPGTTINIKVPPAGSDVPQEVKGRVIFESFTPEMRKALESGSLDEVNRVLGDLSVEDAEELVGQLGEAGILSLEEQIFDTTTEEGKQQLREFEEQNEKEKAAAGEAAVVETTRYADDPE